MPDEINPGQFLTLAQSTSYALPPCVTYIQSSQTIDVSLDNSTWVALSGTTTGSIVTAAQFVRCTSSTTCVVSVKKF